VRLLWSDRSRDKTNPARVDFERLHGLSEKTEGGVLLLGLGVVLLMAAEPTAQRDPKFWIPGNDRLVRT